MLTHNFLSFYIPDTLYFRSKNERVKILKRGGGRGKYFVRLVFKTILSILKEINR